MKIRIKTIAVFLISSMLLSLLTFVSYAADFEECYHCNKTGEFHCQKCGNTGEVVCDGCGGQGRFECPGEEDKGKCDNGYYVCPSCGGDGLSRPIPADGNAGPCGQCGGTGKIECWHCHGAGMIICDRCGGEGKCECTDGNCVEARKIDYKCPYCKGTGFLGDGPDFPPEYNDGVHNIPKEGDHIITDHSSWTGYYYGTGETDKDKQQQQEQGGEGEDDLSERRDPATGRDYVWFIDVGDGVWDIEGQHIVVKRDGSAVSGIMDVKYVDTFTVDGIADGNTHVYLIADGFKTELIKFNGDNEYSVANRDPKAPKVPFNVTMHIEYIEGSAPKDYPQNPGHDGHGYVKRSIDFGEGTWDNDGKPVTALINGAQVSGVVEVGEDMPIKLDGLDRERMKVYLRAEDGFSVTLIPNGDDEFGIGRYEQEDCVLADVTLKFEVEIISKELTVDETDDRASDLIIMPGSDDTGNKSYADIEIDRMNTEEKRYFKELSDDELEEVKEKIKTALESVKTGKADADTDALFKKLASVNGFESVKDGRFFPVEFHGDKDIGFSIKVTVLLDPGELDGGTDLYVYRRLEDGGIEPLGKSEYGTYEDGSVQSFSFYTNGLTSFFTAAKELKLDAEEENTETTGETDVNNDVKTDEKPFPAAVIIISAVGAAAVIAVVIIITVKNKRKQLKNA